jgi:formamidopyrimidine-DNA glycosylase
MPELAEVEFGRKLAHAAAVGRTVVEADVAPDAIVLDGAAPRTVRDALTGATVTGTGRHGKHLWIELDRRPWLLLHFGMTGHLRVRGRAPIQLEGDSRERDEAWPPRFTKLRLVLGDGGELAFTNARRLGRIRLRDEPLEEPPLRRLGFDPLLSMPDAAAFAALIGRRRGLVKGLLLDQTFAAGVGNWIADEVLYRAGIAPTRRVESLSRAEQDRLRRELRHVVTTAVRVDADKERFPRTWLFHRRWGKVAGTIGGHVIAFDTVAGRTTAWVPAVQE